MLPVMNELAGTNLPSILSTIAARCHSFFGHIRRLSTNAPAHKALKLAVDSQVRRHTTARLESPRWQTTDYMDESDCAGHRTHCC